MKHSHLVNYNLDLHTQYSNTLMPDLINVIMHYCQVSVLGCLRATNIWLPFNY